MAASAFANRQEQLIWLFGKFLDSIADVYFESGCAETGTKIRMIRALMEEQPTIAVSKAYELICDRSQSLLCQNTDEIKKKYVDPEVVAEEDITNASKFCTTVALEFSAMAGYKQILDECGVFCDKLFLFPPLRKRVFLAYFYIRKIFE